MARVTGPGPQAFSLNSSYGRLEQRLMAAQAAPTVPEMDTSGYSSLGQFTSKHGKVDDRAISLRTYRKANLKRSITSDPVGRRGMRQMTGGELEGR